MVESGSVGEENSSAGVKFATSNKNTSSFDFHLSHTHCHPDPAFLLDAVRSLAFSYSNLLLHRQEGFGRSDRQPDHPDRPDPSTFTAALQSTKFDRSGRYDICRSSDSKLFLSIYGECILESEQSSLDSRCSCRYLVIVN